MIKVIILAFTLAVSTGSAFAAKICMLYCAPQCQLTFADDGSCSCVCQPMDADNSPIVDNLDTAPSLNLRLRTNSEGFATLVPIESQSKLKIPDVQGSFNNPADGAGGSQPVEKPLTAQEVKDLLEQLFVECKLRGGC